MQNIQNIANPELDYGLHSKQQADVSANNKDRLGSALLGTGILGGTGYLGYQGYQHFDVEDPARLAGKGAKGVVNGVTTGSENLKDTGIKVGKGIYNVGTELIDDAKRAAGAVVKGYQESKEIDLKQVLLNENYVSPATGKINFNKVASDVKNNAGLIAGAGVLGLGTLAGMEDQPDANTGVKAMGAGLMGAAGAGIGHVIHSQVKKNNQLPSEPRYSY